MKGKGQRKDNGVVRVASRARQGAKRKNSFSEAKRAVWRRAGGRRLAAVTAAARDAQQQAQYWQRIGVTVEVLQRKRRNAPAA